MPPILRRTFGVIRMSNQVNRHPALRLTTALGWCALTIAPLAAADDVSPKALQDAQQKLNQQTLERGFSAPDPAAVETYIRDAMKGNIGPRQQPPSYWRSGYTCENALQYSHQDYLDCMYYHRHYGYYW